MNESSIADAQLRLLEMDRGIFEILMIALLVGVVLVVLVQAAYMALCCWEAHRNLSQRTDSLPTSPKNREDSYRGSRG
jgi:hypothetical protein